MKTVKILCTLCIYLTTIPDQICLAGDIACARHAFDAVDAKVQILVTNHFQYAMTDEISDVQKGLFKTAIYYKDKFIANKFMKYEKWTSLMNSMQNMRNIEPTILRILDNPINMLRKLGVKQWAEYWINDISRLSAMKRALLASTTMPLTRAFKLIGSINPSVSLENAIFWMFLNLEEDTASDFEKIGYITCLANALGKYKAVTNDQDAQPTIDSLQNICIAMLNDMAGEQWCQTQVIDKEYMDKQYKMQSSMPREQYQKLKED